jgi:two-component system phosphate regulon sensor histidine kinase PhoR
MSTTKNRQRLGYRRIVGLLVYLVIIPTVLLLAVGIFLMFLGEVFNLVFGILTVAFVLVLVTGSVLVLVFLSREANLSELQADFVSKVSHELRTPLTSIRLFVETMERAKDNPAVRTQSLEALARETDRLTRLIERLLDWGRMEAGRYKLDMHEENVQHVIDETVAAFHPGGPNSDVQLSVEVAADLPTIWADRHAMVDALVNLMSNARKYGGTPPAIVLRAVAFEGGVAFEVKDNGAGIPRPEQRRIFQKFYRIDDRFSRMREGSGLGLAIVSHIVKAHKGRVSVDSAEGKGSTFRIALPAAHAHSAFEPARPAVKASGA